MAFFFAYFHTQNPYLRMIYGLAACFGGGSCTVDVVLVLFVVICSFCFVGWRWWGFLVLFLVLRLFASLGGGCGDLCSSWLGFFLICLARFFWVAVVRWLRFRFHHQGFSFVYPHAQNPYPRTYPTVRNHIDHHVKGLMTGVTLFFVVNGGSIGVNVGLCVRSL